MDDMSKKLALSSSSKYISEGVAAGSTLGFVVSVPLFLAQLPYLFLGSLFLIPSQKKKKKRDKKSSTKMQKNSNGKINPRRPHFFRIILQDTLNKGKISLPKKYVMKHKNDLLGSETVLLKLPDGREWQVGLTKSNGIIWLQDGWEEFVQHYHLKQGSFLVFRYDGSCRFEVIIFDLSTTEIDYDDEACHGQAEDVGDEEKEEEDDDDDDDDDGGDGDGGDGDGDGDADADVSVEINGESPRSPDVQNLMKENADHGLGVIKPHKRYTKEEVAKALAISKSFKSVNPFFKVVMRPSYISLPGYHMEIPSFFTRKHTFMKGAHVILSLHHTDGRRWEVIYHSLIRNECAQHRSSFRHGWSEFVKDNHLKVGDVCVFELVNPRKLKFEVTIYRV